MKKTSGITLIALVITIIVLLILAGVTIVTLGGEDGIISKAMKAKKDTEKSTAKEKLQVEVLGSYDSHGNIELEKLKENISKVGDITNSEPVEFPLEVLVDNYSFEISKDGDVTLKGEAEDTGESGGGSSSSGSSGSESGSGSGSSSEGGGLTITQEELEKLIDNRIKESGYVSKDEVTVLINNAVEDVKRASMYNPGDTYAVSSVNTSGYVTTSGTEYNMTMFLGKPISDSVKTISVTSKVGIKIRQNGNYILGTSAEMATTNFTMQCVKKGENTITVIITVPSKNENTVNNSPVGIVLSNFALKFN